MEELVTYADQLTIRNAEGELEQIGFIPDFSRSHLDLYARMFGGFWINDDSTELTINTQAVVDAIRWEQQFYEKHGTQDVVDFVSGLNRYANSSHPVYAGERLNCQQCHRYPPRNDGNLPDRGFYNGQVAMMVGGAWQVGDNYIPRFQPDLNYGVAPFPPPTDHPERANTTVAQSAVMVIPVGAEDKSAAAHFLAWMLSPEILAETTYARGSLPATRTATQSSRFQQNPGFMMFLDLLNQPNAMPSITTPIDPELNEALGQIEADVLHKGEDPLSLLNASSN